MKKQVLIGALICGILGSSSSMALGIYAGLAGGADYFMYKKSNSGFITTKDAPGKLPVSYNASESSVGPLGMFYMGVGNNWDDFYLAAEIDASYMSLSKQTTLSPSDSEHDSVKETLGPGVSASVLIGGLLESNYKLYGRLGVIYSQFKSSTPAKSTAGRLGVNNLSTWIPGAIAGIGVEKGLGNNVSLRFEVDGLHYFSFSKNTVNPITTDGIEHDYNMKVNYKSLNAIQMIVGVSYTFNQ